MRSFTTPSGLTWTAQLVYLPASPAFAMTAGEPEVSGAVLRFRTGGVALDLVDWPDDWFRLGDDELTKLLRRSEAPLFALPSPRAARRDDV